ncbi:hypothetical protein [Caballeronia sp. AZ7_KS35]|uniref:hypothetical protein n=1 Tax=Caballeronia sp. AZ7_KS35 TaxID=2921762 RepID=UPI0020291AE3|nr:hypothetical protein [Caballeronia sp. AZ7_KS35]
MSIGDYTYSVQALAEDAKVNSEGRLKGKRLLIFGNYRAWLGSSFETQLDIRLVRALRRIKANGSHFMNLTRRISASDFSMSRNLYKSAVKESS